MSQIPSKLLGQILSAPAELQAFIHEMETWEHSAQAFTLLSLREEVKAQAHVISKLRGEKADLTEALEYQALVNHGYSLLAQEALDGKPMQDTQRQFLKWARTQPKPWPRGFAP